MANPTEWLIADESVNTLRAFIDELKEFGRFMADDVEVELEQAVDHLRQTLDSSLKSVGDDTGDTPPPPPNKPGYMKYRGSW